MNISSSSSFYRSILGLSVALVAGLAPLGHSQAQPATALMNLRVNGEALPPERGQLLLQEHIARGAAATPQLQSVVRETLINQTVMAQAAVKAGLDQQPQVRARLDLARQNALAQAWQQQVLQGVQPSDAELQAEYQRQIQVLGSEEVRLRHVLVASEKQAQEVHAQILGGVPFERVAAQISSDVTTRESGGLTDWVALGVLSPAVVKALQGLKEGQLAAPTETAAGWQVLRLEERRPFIAPAIDKVNPQLIRALAQRTLQAQLRELRESAKVE